MSKKEWTPLISGIDVKNISLQAFTESLTTFWASVNQRIADGTRPANPFDHDGWYLVTPEMAEAGLMHSGGNRDISLPAVRAGIQDIENGDWQQTGEPICLSDGTLENGHHRLFMVYFSGQPINTYVVASVPKTPNLFAYYDGGKKRTGPDVLHIAGLNSSGGVLSRAIEQLAIRYDNNALGVLTQPKYPVVKPREVLVYLHAHPDFQPAAQLMLGTYSDAMEVIRSKPAAVFFAWKVLEAYPDGTELEGFCVALGSGANLDEDSPILAAIRRLTASELPGKKMPARTRLAYVCKAFNLWVVGQKMPRTRGGKVAPLTVNIDEDFPKIFAEPLAEAAE
jgi:hypothetical protein